MFVSKATDKVAATQRWEYLCSNGLNEKLQSAYKANHSCKTVLIRVQDDILKAIDSHRGILLLPLDVSGRRSSRFGIKGKALDWLQSHLTNRTHYVKMDDASSTVRPLYWGVRWPTTVTAKANTSRQKQILHGKSKNLTTKPKPSRQN